MHESAQTGFDSFAFFNACPWKKYATGRSHSRMVNQIFAPYAYQKAPKAAPPRCA